LKPDISTDSLKFPGYKPPYRRDRVDRLGGGVVVFVKDEISCVTRLDLQVGSVECIWLEIKINNKKYLYGTFYKTVYPVSLIRRLVAWKLEAVSGNIWFQPALCK
jgi:hypothetical protein